MSRHGADPSYGAIVTHELHWTFPDLPGDASDYAHAINAAWLTCDFDGGLLDLVNCDYMRQVLCVHVRVGADDLLRAIAWGSQLVFGMIERAGLEMPPTATMVASGRAAAACPRAAR